MEITLTVFRTWIALRRGLLGIYILLVLPDKSWTKPLLVMSAIPLTLIGIMPGFWLLNLLFTSPVGRYPDPVFFTATAMIGMIALGGIVIRNSLVLIEFIQDRRKEGLPLREAVLQSGAARMRPILLTAVTTALGAWPITLDPIFSGLAWALIFGLAASTAFTLLVVPVAYAAGRGVRVGGRKKGKEDGRFVNRPYTGEEFRRVGQVSRWDGGRGRFPNRPYQAGGTGRSCAFGWGRTAIRPLSFPAALPAGRVKWKVEPWPGADSVQTRPP